MQHQQFHQKIKHKAAGNTDVKISVNFRSGAINHGQLFRTRQRTMAQYINQTWPLSHRLSSQSPRRVLRHLPLSVQEQLASSPRVSVLQPAPKHLPRSSHDSPVLHLHRVLLPQSVKPVTGSRTVTVGQINAILGFRSGALILTNQYSTIKHYWWSINSPIWMLRYIFWCYNSLYLLFYLQDAHIKNQFRNYFIKKVAFNMLDLKDADNIIRREI